MPTQQTAIVLRNVRPMGGAASDVFFSGGYIDKIVPTDSEPINAQTEIVDGSNDIIMPGFVEGHIHLDKILWGLPFRPISGGPELLDYINNEKRIRIKEVDVPVEIRAGNLIRQCVTKGSSVIRSHCDVDPDYGLSNLEGILLAKEKYASVVDIQIVCFPQSGVMRMPGTAELMDAALSAGANVVGGLDPAMIDKDPAGQLNLLFRLAEKHGCGIDLHLHEASTLGAHTIEMILDRVEAHGMQGKVVIAHAYCLGELDHIRLKKLIERLARNEVAIMTNGPGARAMPPLMDLKDGGVPFYIASDSIRDTWNPFGDGDMLARTAMVSLRQHFRRDSEIKIALEAATHQAAEILGFEDYGLAPGCKADFYTVPGDSVTEVVVTSRERRLVYKSGRLVAENGQYIGPHA
jgi:cytosine/adenosine deaminase-related metal-dependent hydrolase